MTDTYFCLKILRKLFGNTFNEVILNKRSLDKQPGQHNECKQYEQYGAGYFPELLQGVAIICKNTYSALLCKFSTNTTD
jgi:hypothetical protein